MVIDIPRFCVALSNKAHLIGSSVFVDCEDDDCDSLSHELYAHHRIYNLLVKRVLHLVKNEGLDDNHPGSSKDVHCSFSTFFCELTFLQNS